MSTAAADLLREFQTSWPAWLTPVLPDGASETVPGHPLGAEATALLVGGIAALPYFPAGGEATWATLAPGSRELLSALSELRAWVLPSLAREHAQGLVVTGAKAGSLGARLLSRSPAGYARWVSAGTREVVLRVAARLRRARELQQAAPPHTHDAAPALLEIRQQLATALAAGDRLAAEEVLDQLDRLKLDTAQNALLTRIRVWDHFGDARAIVELRELGQLLRLRLPATALTALARAFHRFYLAPLEVDAKLAEAREAYASNVAPTLGGHMAALRTGQGPEARRLLAYRAVAQGDTAATRSIAEAFPDDAVLAALAPPGPVGAEAVSAVPDEEQFFTAWRLQNWVELQRIGHGLIASHPHIRPVLERSLSLVPNPELWQALHGAGKAAAPSTPQTWAEWFAALPGADEGTLEHFLRAGGEGESGRLPIGSLDDLCERLSDVLTAPAGSYTSSRSRLLTAGLAELIGQSVAAPGFPAAGEVDLYRLLAQCWAERKCGSAYPPDGQVLLELAGAVLQSAPGEEGMLADLAGRWWKVRPARALLPFALAAVELFHRLGTGGHAEHLWVLAGEFVRQRPQFLTGGERLLWRQIGRDIGYDDATLDEYIPAPASGAAEADPIRLAALTKIAIVSTREEQALRAADLLRERTDAEVIVVTATAAGHETRSAASADVIAYVWGASTHAVYRAFDKVDRRKIAYVRGTGVGSIILAVERWTFENIPGAAGIDAT